MDNYKLDGRRIVVEKAGAPQRRPRPSGPRPDDKCFECGRKGHW